jgi:DNA polymerase-3 subunit gamma/tau
LQELNLARKWRPQQFDKIVGQEIPIRMLKNSLYLNKLFPVYLFAGQRGCGKTSTARIFGAALNCKELKNFQNDSQIIVPCLKCESCVAMANSHHPDFIEIDAASHTGVDNVRNIIDASSYLPILGKKKIYLIDEAHMLSKAAFNALLKILEEPPESVTFILATTESSKIPPTVLSRCFQVIFSPLGQHELIDHLKNICSQENIIIDDDALKILLAETEGSARDAINLLERVRFSGDNVTGATVLKLLGKIGYQDLFTLFSYILDNNTEKLLTHLDNISFEQLSPNTLWEMLVLLSRTLVWVKYKTPVLPALFSLHKDTLDKLAQKCSITRLLAILQLFWSQEETFLKTTKKHIFLEHVLIQICNQVNLNDISNLLENYTQEGLNPELNKISLPERQNTTKTHISVTNKTSENNIQKDKNFSQEPLASTPINLQEKNIPWDKFLDKLETLNNPLLKGILTQVTQNYSQPDKILTITLKSSSKFFKDTLEEHKNKLLPIAQECFCGCKELIILDGPVTTQPQNTLYNRGQNIQPQINNPLNEIKLGPTAHLITELFPGKIKKIDN